MIDYEKVDKLVENCKNLYPDIPDSCLWVLAWDYYIHEEKDEDEDENTKKEREQIKKEPLEAFLKAKEEYATTKYENIKVMWIFFLLYFMYTLWDIQNIKLCTCWRWWCICSECWFSI